LTVDEQSSMLFKAFIIWILLLILAVLNGAIRDLFISPRLGEQAGHVISTVILCATIFLVAWLSIRWIGADSGRNALLVGIQWVLLTIAFEFLAGHYLFGHTWERLLADYNLFGGRVWVFVLAANLLAPLWAFWQKAPG
jgi:hypothetical protein